MLTSMETIDKALQHMTLTTATMRDDMSIMNRNISRPMSFFNTFMPW
jgi:hypothetical protein